MFSLKVCNIDGLQKDGRWEFVCDNLVDFMALTETHATDFVHTKFDKKVADSPYGILWGEPLGDRLYAGVAFVYRKSSAWSVQKIEFQHHPCNKFYREGRLMAVQVHRSSQKRSCIFYILYGIAGARWDAGKRKMVQNMISAVQRDATTRGAMATVICGDFNLEITDFPAQAEQLSMDRWVDAAHWGCDGFCDQPTSLKGKGSRIDLAFVNNVAASMMSTYELQDGVHAKDHSILSLSLNCPLAAQTWYMPREQGSRADYCEPPSDYVPPRIFRDNDLHILLRKCDIDGAYKAWCKRAEKYLVQIPMTDGQPETVCNRGHTAFRKLCVQPPERQAVAEDLWSRKLAKAMRQTRELQIMQVYGYRADVTFCHLQNFFRNNRSHFSDLPESFCTCLLSRDCVGNMALFLQTEYRSWQTKVKNMRLRAWKDRLQSSIRESYKWCKGQRKVEPAPMKLPDGSCTVDRSQQLDAILQAWSPIFQKYKSREPDVAVFAEHFGPFIRSHRMTVSDLTSDMLVAAAVGTKKSAASLDRWRPDALRALALWFPGIYDDLAVLLNAVENGLGWPAAMLQGYTSLVPKSEDTQILGPTEYRPISALSGVYRLWGKARFPSLLKWQEQWALHGVHGCRKGRSAEELAFRISIDLETPAYDSGMACVAGLSYDFRKAFDLIPINVMLWTLEQRGLDARLVFPLRSLYQGLQRVFRLHGAVGQWWKAYNGIIQGDSLSMCALNSIVSCILEAETPTIPRVVSNKRSYADDLSLVAMGPSLQVVADTLRNFHSVIRAYVGCGCGELNLSKSFTFGNQGVAGILGPEVQHLQAFRIVGGAFVQRGRPVSFTELETQRWARWQFSIGRIRHVPRPWHQRSRMLMSTQSQATFASGLHGISQGQELNKIRSCVMRALWKCDTYSMSPFITLSLLAPVQLDPNFGVLYEGLRCVMRGMRDHHIAATMRRRFALQPLHLVDGPSQHLRFLADHSVLGTVVNTFMSRSTEVSFHEDSFLHELRETWRRHLWQKAADGRPDHYGGAQCIDRGRSLKYCEELRCLADAEDQVACVDFDKTDVRAKLGILRRILAGGIMTPERYARHKRQHDQMCACGLEKETVMHVSWSCPRYSTLRQPILDLFAELGVQQSIFPACFQYAAIVPENFPWSDKLIHTVQSSLVAIWQQATVDWYAGTDLQQKQSKMQATRTMVGDLILENGHLLASRSPQDGMWCKLCGKYVANMKHIRLKITKVRCPMEGGPLLSQEGFLTNANHLDFLE